MENCCWEQNICTVVSILKVRSICKWLSLFMDKGTGRESWMLDRLYLAWSLSSNWNVESLSDYPTVGQIINYQIYLWGLMGKHSVKNLRIPMVYRDICKLVCSLGGEVKGWMALRLKCSFACQSRPCKLSLRYVGKELGKKQQKRRGGSLDQHCLFLYK